MAKPVQAPQFSLSSGVKNFIWAAAFIGVLTLAIGFSVDKVRTLHSFVTSLFYFTSLTVGGLFFTAVLNVVKAGWGVTIRRITESLTAFLPYVVVLGLLFALFGAPFIYPWLNPQAVAADELLQHKAGYLNKSFFLIRYVIYFALWALFTWKIVGSSLRQDKDGSEMWTTRSLKWSVAFMIVFALSYSLFSVDTMMSLDPHWYSTMFGVYCFSGLFQSTLAFIILVTIFMIKRGLLDGLVNENHLHDLGKLMFAFTIFYAYIAFSQFMLIWYANIPEETMFFLDRSHGTWLAVSYSLLVFKFIVPFLLLLPRNAKRNTGSLIRISVLLLIMQYVDFYWLVYPNLNHETPLFSFYEVGVFIGFLGVFLATISRFLGRHSVVPLKDPRISEALHHHT